MLAYKKKDPNAGIVDSQSVKTIEKDGSRNMMEPKKSKAEQRHLLVDKHDFLVKAIVTQAGLNDRDGLELILKKLDIISSKIKNMVGYELSRAKN